MRFAFSLLELLIVIVIIGVVYTLAITNLSMPTKERAQPSLATLKEYLLHYSDKRHTLTLRCESCDSCMLYSNNKLLKTIPPFFDKTIERYSYDPFMGAVAIEDPYCFTFSITPHGVAEQIFVRYQERVYDYTPYFAGTQTYDSIDALLDAKEQLRSEIE